MSCRSLVGLGGPLLALSSLVLVTPDAAAQCGPDGINGSCCTPVVPTLPTFPAVSLPGSNICWTGCAVANQVNTTVSWSAPAALSCTEFLATLSVVDTSSTLPIMSGPMILDYTRTWQEMDPFGSLHQVWRFVAKADLTVVPVGVVWNCEAPSCIFPLGPQPHAFYYGYVDYSHPCVAAAPFDNAIVLHHACDFFIHRPGLSSAPGVYHPNRSYAIVAPHSATQPFLPGNALAPQGPAFFEATRDFGSLVPPLCFDEDPLQNGQSSLFAGFCLTSLTNNPKQHSLRSLLGNGVCVNSSGMNGGFQSVGLNFPTVPWFHLVTTSMGTWTNGNVYPGKEQAWVDEGVFIHRNVCTGDWVNVNYGGTTKNGWTIVHPVLINTFTDLADNYNARLTGPFPTPIVGNMNLSTKLIYTMGP